MKYIFTLAAVDSKRHLTALAELVALIDRPDFLICWILCHQKKQPINGSQICYKKLKKTVVFKKSMTVLCNLDPCC